MHLKSKPPLVSIGMPVFNGAEWLPDTLDSILNQTFSDFELIISDNASIDGTEAVCTSYQRNDARIRYYRNTKNLGGPKNYNTVFELSKGTYFKWASSNDLCDTQMVERCVEVLENRPDVVLCYPKTRLFHEDTGEIEEYEDNLDLQQSSPCERFTLCVRRMRLNNIMNGLIRSEILRKTPLMKMHVAEDINLMAELSLHGKFAEVPEFLFTRRISPSVSTILRSNEDINKHYDPSGVNGMQLQNWKIYSDYVSAIVRTPLATKEKLCLFRFALKLIRWHRLDLLGDLRAWLRYNRFRRQNTLRKN